MKPKPQRRPTPPTTVWAVIIMDKRSTWINVGTLSFTRKGAWEKYKETWIPEYQWKAAEAKQQGAVRLARVQVSEIVKP